MPENWNELTEFALELARASAGQILPYFRNGISVDVKKSLVWDPVTEGDRAGERIMRAMIEKRYPEHGILGEEFGVKESRSSLTWVLDPIDGTRAFICGMPTWATLIGLVQDDAPVIGVMHQPFVGETFHANPGGSWSTHGGRTRNLATRPYRALHEATVTTTAPELYRSDFEKSVLARMTKAARLTRYGGDAYFFCMMAAGQVDIAMDAHMEAYDIAPLIPIIRGAGGLVCTWDRDDPSRGGNIIAASCEKTLDEALAVIRQ